MPTGVYIRTKVSWLKGRFGENSPHWKGGLWDREYYNAKRKEWRHNKGISKGYAFSKYKYNGISHTKEYKKLHRKLYKYMRKNAGELTIPIIQIIYEDNIKKFGTLTCYLCLKPVLFGKDNLEHKIPLSRGGTNARDNLDIACEHCNKAKHSKTETEYKEIFI
jgi:5-methylcytosine-specific restriction endonuclease McrA